MSIGIDFQIVLQTEQTNGSFLCETVAGVPTVFPAMIVLATNGTPGMQAEAGRLRRELFATLSSIGGSLRQWHRLAVARAPDPCVCHAHKNPACRKVLVLLGDSTTAISWRPYLSKWCNGGSQYTVLPAFPAGASPATLLPTPLRNILATFWDNNVTELALSILSAAGISPNESRLFISYRTSDTEPLAIQLFDALSRQTSILILIVFGRNPVSTWRNAWPRSWPTRPWSYCWSPKMSFRLGRDWKLTMLASTVLDSWSFICRMA